jgi:alkanesulfonate monooxygenase SsuD/methylene tetrahydromethanopterin reductase-like flavin-dependent oxidoreductase (luciferase family)
MFVLATGRGVDIAARLGLPVVVGGPLLDTEDLTTTLARYRRDFRPHLDSTPWVTVCLDILLADDDATARDLALPEAWAMAVARRDGEFPPLEPVTAVRTTARSAQVQRRVDAWLDRVVAGGPATVRRRLDRLLERTHADELMSSASTHDHDALLRSDRTLRDLLA